MNCAVSRCVRCDREASDNAIERGLHEERHSGEGLTFMLLTMRAQRASRVIGFSESSFRGSSFSAAVASRKAIRLSVGRERVTLKQKENTRQGRKADEVEK